MTNQLYDQLPHTLPSAEERGALDDKLARERAWYANTPRFQTIADVMNARAAGVLHPIPDSPDFRPIWRFVGPKPPEGTYALLTRRAITALTIFGTQWRTELRARGIDDHRLRLPLSSMTRTQECQVDIVDRQILAVLDSTHPTGNTWDTDASAYTLWTDEEGFVAIVDPERIVNPDDAVRYTRNRERYGDYQPAVTAAAIAAADVLHSQDIVNRVLELDGTPSRGLHMATNPALQVMA